jgi:hypothetical protein
MFVATSLVERSRIYAALEEDLQLGIDRRLAERANVERVDAKRWNVTLVKNEGMTQRNRPLIMRGIVDQTEERCGALAIEAVPIE